MKKMKFYIKQIMMFAIVGATAFSIACTESEPDDTKLEDPISSFQFEVGDPEFLKVTFSNFSQNATSYSWDFGDNATSTDENPEHTYAAEGSYTVTLTAINDAGSATSSKSIELTDPLASQRRLIGENGKTWQLLADASTGLHTYLVGPTDRTQVWWSFGQVSQLCDRECIMDDTWTFNTDGTFTFDNHGDFWGEEGVWASGIAATCFDATVASNFVGANGEDLSGWNSGTHDFTFDPVAGKLVITGGFIGLTKVASTEEVTQPQASVTYTVAKLVDADVDTMVLETVLTAAGGYWGFTLVSYDNPADEVVVGECEDTGGGTTIDAVSIDFETNPPVFEPFGGTVTFAAVANPVSGGINTSATVGQVDQAAGVEGWAGIATGLAGKVDFSTKTTFKMKVYSPAVGQVIKFKLEETGNGGNNKEVDATTTVANAWEELTFTFDAADSGKWDRLALFFDFQGAAKAGANLHYFDDIVLQ